MWRNLHPASVRTLDMAPLETRLKYLESYPSLESVCLYFWRFLGHWRHFCDEKDGEMAEKAILQAGVDMIDVGRGFLVNPNFGNDVLEGRSCGKCLHCRPACKWSPFLNDGTVVCPGRNLFLRNQKQ